MRYILLIDIAQTYPPFPLYSITDVIAGSVQTMSRIPLLSSHCAIRMKHISDDTAATLAPGLRTYHATPPPPTTPALHSTTKY